jgi:hypothetical protein
VTIDPDAERQLAVELFNLTWELLESSSRTPEDDDRMMHAAHGSRYHWGQVGGPVNLVRGEWQCSRVYAVLGRVEPAIHHAERCLELCRQNDIGDFDLAYAYEALARSHGVAGHEAASGRFAQQAREAGERIAEADDREQFQRDLATL